MRYLLTMRYLITLLVITILFSCSVNDDVVATVGNVEITVGQLKEKMQPKFPHKKDFKDVELAHKKQFLDQLITKQLKINEAIARGYDKEESFEVAYYKQKVNVLGTRYYERFIIDKLITEQEIRQYFEKSKEEIKASHILISFKSAPKSRNTRSKEDALNLANELAQRVKNGQNINELAFKYSDEASRESRKGDLGFVKWGKMVKPFEKALFAMEEGSVSDPILTDFGYHIIQAFERKKNPAFIDGNFDKQKLPIKQALYRTVSDKALKMWKAHIDSVREELSFEYKWMEAFGLVLSNKSRARSGTLAKGVFSKAENSSVLARWDGYEYTVEDLAREVHPQRFHSTFSDTAQMRKSLEFAVLQRMMVMVSEGIDLHEEPEIAKKLKNYRTYSLVSQFDRIEIQEKSVPDENQIKNYYEQNKPEYTIPEKLDISTIIISDKELANTIYKKAKKGADFKKLAVKYTEDSQGAKKFGFIGRRSVNEMGTLTQYAFKGKTGEVLKPVEFKGKWQVIKLGKRYPSLLHPFEVVQQRVAAKVSKLNHKENSQKALAALKDKYPVVVYDDKITNF